SERAKVVALAKAKKKRRLFDELMEAAEEINQWREGKIALKTYTVDPQPQTEVTPEIILHLKELAV
ncbi:MAG: hypothetical protein ACOYOS_21095, partial [Syntrophales bacterium]